MAKYRTTSARIFDAEVCRALGGDLPAAATYESIRYTYSKAVKTPRFGWRDEDGEVWVYESHAEMAEWCGISPKQARRNFEVLVRKGWIEKRMAQRVKGEPSRGMYRPVAQAEVVPNQADPYDQSGITHCDQNGTTEGAESGTTSCPTGHDINEDSFQDSPRREESKWLTLEELKIRFEAIWQLAPRRVGANRHVAWLAFRTACHADADIATQAHVIETGVAAWAAHVDASGADLQFEPSLTAFINDKRYCDDWSGATDWLGQEDKGHG